MSTQHHKAKEDERSPLIDAQRQSYDSDFDSERFSGPSSCSDNDLKLGDSFVETKSTWYLILLTLGIGGLQIVWSVELSNGSPYLLSLGMSKSLMAFVWLAGPMTGVLVQPYIGMVSDRCRISWGKRKPFIVAGTLGTVGSSLILAYARQIVQTVGSYDNDAVYEGAWKVATIAFATVMMWVLDFSVNTLQASIRAFIVDGAPTHQQEASNAWASRIVGIGNVLGYVAGYLNLPKHFAFLGREQFQVLCALASIVLVTVVSISVFTIKERNPQHDITVKEDHQSGILTIFNQVLDSIKRLPAPIRTVCQIQFFNWMGWFPFLFYITTYIGQLYVDPRLEPGLTPAEVDQLWAQATRIGTFALLIEAIVSLSTNVLLPFLIMPTYKPTSNTPENPDAPSSSKSVRAETSSYNEVQRKRFILKRTTSTFSADMGLHSELGQLAAKPVTPFLQRTIERMRIPGFTLRRAWLLAQLLFSTCMFSTFFITTPMMATIMVAVAGVTWSLTLWAPFALISAEISRRDEVRRKKRRERLLSGNADDFYGEHDHEEDQAGIILGLHNVAVSAPQVIATLVSSAVFKALQKPRNIPGDVSVAWTLRLGGIAVLVAAFFTWKMRESVTEEGEDDQ